MKILSAEQSFAIAVCRKLNDRHAIAKFIKPYIVQGLDYDRMIMVLAYGGWLTAEECKAKLKLQIATLLTLPTIALAQSFAELAIVELFRKRADLEHLMSEMTTRQFSSAIAQGMASIEAIEKGSEIP